MKKLATLIVFLFILIFGCSCSLANGSPSVNNAFTPELSSYTDGIEAVSDFDLISEEIEAGNYFLTEDAGQNISSKTNNPNEQMLSLSKTVNSQNDPFYIHKNKKEKLTLTNKTFILQTSPRAP